ncbi:hypothetical protein, partial [Mesorhizobium sp. M2A.F.Ca.ET.037.01.1.1]|uniref:hypothetical protein n=1 Tax=Mesorhizobium sp. M2A.F.Ca.ET.037.01.1.1 TaxID=2496748 RepID=UPI001AEC8DA1
HETGSPQRRAKPTAWRCGDRIIGRENCYLCIRFKVLPIYPLDSRAAGAHSVRRKLAKAGTTASFSPSLYGEKCPAGQ